MLQLDATDRRILTLLEAEGRLPILELAGRVGLSPTPCGRRVKRLEEAGIIRGYGARIDHRALGFQIGAFISVRLGRVGPEGTAQFLSAIARLPEVVECHLVTGNNIDYMLRTRLRDVDALGHFIRDKLQGIPSVGETSTMVILSQEV
ncbi:MAG: Lrp/AsnC family transcriptional regulator [Paracoccus sp. (in: a-proteobacteria)]|uniref:Lrp/AsnC family transcriptional regulator n=1 Tax=Paracoccus sp. TaxID=267 RepID=UPI0039E53D10